VTFEEENLWIAKIRTDADSGADQSYREMLRRRVQDRKAKWTHIDEGGDFSSDELTTLIERAHALLQRIAPKT
jgi:hypothetical protein